MKNIKIIGFLGLLLFTVSCDDFLEEEPRDQQSVDQFFAEPGQAESAVNFLYQNGVPEMFLSQGVFRGSDAMYLQYLSGFFDNEFNGQERQVDLAQQLAISPTEIDRELNRIWQNLYQGISGANLAIANIPDTPGLSDDERNDLTAQASFFRAFAYFYLVRMFGDVPLIIQPVDGLDEVFVPRAPVSEVYAQIVADLNVATTAGSLPSGNMVENGFRITTETAQMLLSEVYLTMSGFPLSDDNYANSATAIRAVINSGDFSLVPHDLDGGGNVIPESSAYNKMRQAKTLANDYIYQIEYEAGIRSSPYPQWSFPASVSGSVGSAYANIQNAYGPRPALYDQYDQNLDLRVQEKQYFHTTFTTADNEEITFPVTPYIWLDEEPFFNSAQSSQNLRVYSYPEALLIAAEAIARSEGVTAEAVDYLTQVRARAYWTTDPETIRAGLAVLSVGDFVEEVWKERNRELIFDQKLWFDMVRTRLYPAGANGDVTFINLVGAQNTFGQTFQEKHLLLPISISEMQRNPELVQNPGY
ncbi:RagB/SusD family nutrient uptake outer membrane protein [Poritiphilus flavus]|uniref:RagB/SusD family nutrient uptake outer membrane protein n=1 Tax=Poritiphilus flavus TaxID=2697053 RepID=A0A6L9EC40_9FLAO|nr:RagB/SusD family nutrient uptake outer membrane protein [Poritiphilus flavus]NAS12295.1 RagB/SusD family nutrient uptake outer membrane protein [Poritiphilus flavus]